MKIFKKKIEKIWVQRKLSWHFKGNGNGDGSQEMQQGGNKSTAGRQLSKAERYRWIIQEPKQNAIAAPQPKASSSSSTKRGNFWPVDLFWSSSSEL